MFLWLLTIVFSLDPSEDSELEMNQIDYLKNRYPISCHLVFQPMNILIGHPQMR
jgi:hypothetical protein